jgi:hypothetical protein
MTTLTGRVHELKTWPIFWDDLEADAKKFEIRRNDREGGFNVGDVLHLREYDNKKKEYTGREMRRVVTSTLKTGRASNWGLQPGFMVLSIEPEGGQKGWVRTVRK